MKQMAWPFARTEAPATVPHWTSVRVTPAQRDRLNRLAAELQAAHEAGRTKLPNEFAEHVPIHHLIERLLDQYEAKRARSRAWRPRGGCRRPDQSL